jgi:hypothetical protein
MPYATRRCCTGSVKAAGNQTDRNTVEYARGRGARLLEHISEREPRAGGVETASIGSHLSNVKRRVPYDLSPFRLTGVMIVTIFSLLIPFIGYVLHPLILATWAYETLTKKTTHSFGM